LEEAQGAAQLAADAEKSQNWDECIHQAGIAIMTAGAVLELRNIRSRCRFEKGEVAEGVSDLHHVLQMNSGSTEPHLRISAMTFYSLGETDKGLAQVRKCLQSDPDSKSCRQLMRTEKNLSKRLKPLNEFVEKRQFASASKLLVKQGDNDGLINDAKADFDQFVSEGLIHSKAPNGLYARLLELACEAYIEVRPLWCMVRMTDGR
jgi:DnaJ family protein C protein 3